jgi:hypothetical protein
LPGDLRPFREKSLLPALFTNHPSAFAIVFGKYTDLASRSKNWKLLQLGGAGRLVLVWPGCSGRMFDDRDGVYAV